MSDEISISVYVANEFKGVETLAYDKVVETFSVPAWNKDYPDMRIHVVRLGVTKQFPLSVRLTRQGTFLGRYSSTLIKVDSWEEVAFIFMWIIVNKITPKELFEHFIHTEVYPYT
jgi:hypothetical protein